MATTLQTLSLAVRIMTGTAFLYLACFLVGAVREVVDF
jgi:hypothetical protein